MRHCLIAAAILAAASIADSAALGPYGLSGWFGLPNSDVIPAGSMRIGGLARYMRTEPGDMLVLPLRGCWGVEEDLELAAELPLVPVDNAWEGSFIGDLTLAGAWKYEQTRGGTALKLSGRVTLPTGEEHRDNGTELAFGGVTSTTFRAFRLSMAGEYVLGGGRNPFSGKIEDSFNFTAGGASFIGSDFLMSAGLHGSTTSAFRAFAGSQYTLSHSVTVECGISAGLDGYEKFALAAGVYWTGEGF
jgi:hypothetical protein